MGFAPCSLLCKLSFPDVLDEEKGVGYQRRINTPHSLNFREYISGEGATTIPLTLNLRHPSADRWLLERHKNGTATLTVLAIEKIFSQVDCQHRLGHLADRDISLPFMTFLGLTVREEMEIFNVINGKAKGLNPSLIDYHEATLRAPTLANAKPELHIAMQLNERKDSPWCQRLDLGGNGSVGLKRYASLRTMQKAARRFLKTSQLDAKDFAVVAPAACIAFWKAIQMLLPQQWDEPRRHLLIKGIGVYSLMSLAGDLVREGRALQLDLDDKYFAAVLSDFIRAIDWSNHGPMRGFGGQSGADRAYQLIRDTRRIKTLRVHARA